MKRKIYRLKLNSFCGKNNFTIFVVYTIMNISGRFFASIDLLSPEECKHFIKVLDNDELTQVERPDLATYDRNIIIDDVFAEEIYKRIQSYLPPNTVRCNECFRFSKYHPGQEFLLHRDGTNMDKYRNLSKYTVNIFLNTEFTGGETDFFDDVGNLAFRATPTIGLCTIFDREILHRGNKVLSGNKYLLRTDVMIDIGIQPPDEDTKKEIHIISNYAPV